MTDAQIKHMVQRFLGWRLPENFNPDAGISFKKTFNDHLPVPQKHNPSGTNLLDATQAEAMVRHMIEGLPCADRPLLAAAEEGERLRALVYMPGQWRCPKCEFQLTQSNLNARDGSVTARDDPGDKCPNCDSPLWRVSYRDAFSDMMKVAEQAIDEKSALQSRLAAADAVVSAVRASLHETEMMNAWTARQILTSALSTYEGKSK